MFFAKAGRKVPHALVAKEYQMYPAAALAIAAMPAPSVPRGVAGTPMFRETRAHKVEFNSQF